MKALISIAFILHFIYELHMNRGGRYKVQGGGVYKVQGEGVYKVQDSEDFSEKGRL